MTFDVTSNSPCFTRDYKAIWKDNLAIYWKSIRVLLKVKNVDMGK